MFMLEVMSEEAKKLIQHWSKHNIPLSNFEFVQQQGYVHIRCLCHFETNSYVYNTTARSVQLFIRSSKSPFILSSEDIPSCVSAYNQEFKHIFINGHLDGYLDFKWPEQIERYRVALLFKATE